MEGHSIVMKLIRDLKGVFVFDFLIYSNPFRPVLQCYIMWLHTM